MNIESSNKLADIRSQSQRRMVWVLGITLAFIVVELITALFSKSLALLADAGHMVTDVGAIILSLIAFWFASKPATPGKSYGYYRSEILAGLINALILVCISLYIMYEAWQRLKDPPAVLPVPVFCVAVIGLLVNLFCLKLLGGGKHEAHKSINLKAAYLEIYGDALVSSGVIISSLVIFFNHWYGADAIVSLLIGLFILPRTWILLSECTNILMEGTPKHIDLQLLRSSLLTVEGVVDVHDIHVWTITSGLDAMSAHVLIDKEAKLDQVLESVTKLVQEKFNLNHTTIQIEQAACQTEANICS